MPCRSDYLEQNSREAELQRAAKLYMYVLKKQNLPVPDHVANAAAEYYCKDDQPLLDLCKHLRSLKRKDKKIFESIVYNAKDKTSRDLATWYEDHIAADLQRVRKERAEANKARLRKSGLSKLSLAEKVALDLEDME